MKGDTAMDKRKGRTEKLSKMQNNCGNESPTGRIFPTWVSRHPG